VFGGILIDIFLIANEMFLEQSVAKDGWEEDTDKIAGTIEKDKVMILAQLNRRVFIRAW
jgi:hypothetical protein